MPRGYRLLIALALGMTIFISLGVGAYFGSLYAPPKRDYRTIGSYAAQNYPSGSPKNGLSDVSGIDGLVERIIAKPQPRSADDRDQRDLAAQESMAVFAYWMFWAVVLQTVLAGGALIALIKDLKQNRRTAEQQLRAYVSVEMSGVEFGLSSDGIKAAGNIVLKNGGQTPAYLCCHAGNIIVRTDEQAERDIMRRQHEHLGRAQPFTLHMSDPQLASVYAHEPIKWESLREIVESDKWLYVFGLVYYQDAFGINRTTRFCVKTDDLELPPEDPVVRAKLKPPKPKQTTWVMADFHNDST